MSSSASTSSSLTTPPSSVLADFLRSSKEKYLQDIRNADHRDSQKSEWIVVMGNEAGDLDSIASSVALAWLLTKVHPSPNYKPTSALPLIQMRRADMRLRAENVYAVSLAGVERPEEDLLFLDDLEDIGYAVKGGFPLSKVALVDHNRLSLPSTLAASEPVVVAIVDHHADEGYHTSDDTNPRIVAPAGSCASHVAGLFENASSSNILISSDTSISSNTSTSASDKADIPAELATLLLTAILIDTNGLSPKPVEKGGKTTDVDRRAGKFLLSKSTLASSSNSFLTTSSGNATSTSSDITFFPSETEASSISSPIQELSSLLASKKADVAHLGPRDLLRRDYKEYTYTLSKELLAALSREQPPEIGIGIKAGLATVPIKLVEWAAAPSSPSPSPSPSHKLSKKEKKKRASSFLDTLQTAAHAWMTERGIHVLGILTSYRGEKKGKHKREMAWVVRTDLNPLNMNNDGGGEEGRQGEVDFTALAERLWAGLESDPVLEVEAHPKLALSEEAISPNMRVRVYTQNPHATRKVTAPVLKGIMEGGAGGKGQADN